MRDFAIYEILPNKLCKNTLRLSFLFTFLGRMGQLQFINKVVNVISEYAAKKGITLTIPPSRLATTTLLYLFQLFFNEDPW